MKPSDQFEQLWKDCCAIEHRERRHAWGPFVISLVKSVGVAMFFYAGHPALASVWTLGVVFWIWTLLQSYIFLTKIRYHKAYLRRWVFQLSEMEKEI